VAAIERLVAEGSDRDLNRINVLAFAAKNGLKVDDAIAAFLHGSRLGIFVMAWNVLCPGCGGVLGEATSLKGVHEDVYACSLCAAGYEPTLDEMVEIVFTISPRVRHIAGHDPESLSPPEYYRQVFWGSGVDLPVEGLEREFEDATLDILELPGGQKALLTVLLRRARRSASSRSPTPPTSSSRGEPTKERQNVAIAYNDLSPPSGRSVVHAGQLRLALENQTKHRVLPTVWIRNDRMHQILSSRRPFLTARRLLTNQTFRDLFRADALDVNQRSGSSA